MPPFHFEKREYIRVRCDVPVRYKFLSKEISDPDFETIHDGTTNNLGGGGIMLSGKIPKLSWLPHLLTHKIFVGINLHLPDVENPIKALTRVVWIETFDQKSPNCLIGLKFRDIMTLDQDKVLKFIIRSQIKS